VLAGGEDPEQRMRELFEERAAYYRKAHHELDTELKPVEAIATEVVGLARHHGGW
jgi:hypothetical protein